MVIVAKPLPEDFYRTMWLIRRFEQRAIELVKAGEIGSGIHPCIGQEAVAVGVCAALRDDDVILSNHRGHGHLLAKGSDPARFMAELAARVTGIDRGRGGSFHPSDFSVGVYGASGTVGHGAAIATGAAWAVGQDSDRVVVSFFGDGAVNQGALLESLNLASLWRVPVVFVCENNRYATTLPIDTAVAGSITGRGAAFGIPSRTVDGMDPEVVFDAAAAAVARARAGDGPSLLEFSTYRFDGHHTFEHRMRLNYRDEQEREEWLARPPRARPGARVPGEVRASIEAEIEVLVDEAVRFAVESPKPDPLDAFDYLYSSSIPIRPGVSNA
jgi:acetoin:2,6-dichlorophenolindophenol oxidoreductase subunit alpha